ncbi:DNA replication protein [Paenibacillus cellulosilyticus]|uniref:DNA replication protein n=1 Tax=Paenibacillus cellulosilyticus TaxID=375489 RepID=A0A2V2YW47_9BACL|nr:DnaD domain-containing protein [Paenibacillus cellulosilyticus]PWW05502.1 DNA replication protein [Paenibacillus cellulosilyticus]QKS45460.1 DnaD domain-containing protein [Paenibacillus cellulosilyticus]
MKDEIWKAYARGLSDAMSGGGVFIPSVLLRTYSSLGLEESDVLLLFQLMAFRDAEGIDFPTPEQLAERMGKPVTDIVFTLRKLMKEGMLTIEEDADLMTDIRSERYDWTSWLLRAGQQAAAMKREAGAQASAANRQTASTAAAASEGLTVVPSSDNLFSVFEQEFGRPLSPMECETIAAWLDQDRYSDDIIRFALKEAVFAGKLHFRYIDRILLEWSRNRVTNPDEARAHSQKFRGGRS